MPNEREPRSELARYAYGFSNTKPGVTYWLIVAGIVIATGLLLVWTTNAP